MNDFLITIAAVLAGNALTACFVFGALTMVKEARQGVGETNHSLWIYPAMVVPLLFFALGAYLIDLGPGTPAQQSFSQSAH